MPLTVTALRVAQLNRAWSEENARIMEMSVESNLGSWKINLVYGHLTDQLKSCLAFSVYLFLSGFSRSVSRDFLTAAHVSFK